MSIKETMPSFSRGLHPVLLPSTPKDLMAPLMCSTGKSTGPSNGQVQALKAEQSHRAQVQLPPILQSHSVP